MIIDYTFCYDGKDCPKKDTCFRWVNKPKDKKTIVSWANFFETGKKNSQCEYFISIENNKNINNTNNKK